MSFMRGPAMSRAHALAALTAGATLADELAPTRIELSFAPDAALDAAKVTKLVSARGSRFKLTPDMRLAYNFDDREKLDRMPAARARLQQLKGLLA